MKMLIDKIIASRMNQYTHEGLYHDIENLDEIAHQFSLVAIKDTFNKFPSRFLLYYDKIWKCWFFFSYKTLEYSNEENIQLRLSNSLHLDKDKVSLKFVTERMQPKFSLRDNVNKVYLHKLYVGQIADFDEELMKDEFLLDGMQYRWMSIAQMEDDARIMEINSDVVAMIKEKIV